MSVNHWCHWTIHWPQLSSVNGSLAIVVFSEAFIAMCAWDFGQGYKWKIVATGTPSLPFFSLTLPSFSSPPLPLPGPYPAQNLPIFHSFPPFPLPFPLLFLFNFPLSPAFLSSFFLLSLPYLSPSLSFLPLYLPFLSPPFTCPFAYT